jgi:hypothetical protein
LAKLPKGRGGPLASGALRSQGREEASASGFPVDARGAEHERLFLGLTTNESSSRSNGRSCSGTLPPGPCERSRTPGRRSVADAARSVLGIPVGGDDDGDVDVRTDRSPPGPPLRIVGGRPVPRSVPRCGAGRAIRRTNTDGPLCDDAGGIARSHRTYSSSTAIERRTFTTYYCVRLRVERGKEGIESSWWCGHGSQEGERAQLVTAWGAHPAVPGSRLARRDARALGRRRRQPSLGRAGDRAQQGRRSAQQAAHAGNNGCCCGIRALYSYA